MRVKPHFLMFVDVKKQRDRILEENKMNRIVAVVILLSVILAVVGYLMVENHHHHEMSGKVKSGLITVDEPRQNNPPVAVVVGTNGFRIEGLHVTAKIAE